MPLNFPEKFISYYIRIIWVTIVLGLERGKWRIKWKLLHDYSDILVHYEALDRPKAQILELRKKAYALNPKRLILDPLPPTLASNPEPLTLKPTA